MSSGTRREKPFSAPVAQRLTKEFSPGEVICFDIPDCCVCQLTVYRDRFRIVTCARILWELGIQG